MVTIRVTLVTMALIPVDLMVVRPTDPQHETEEPEQAAPWQPLPTVQFC